MTIAATALAARQPVQCRFGSALQFDVQRASYTRPIGITQVIRRPGSTEVRRLPGWVLNGFHGLRGFLRVRVVNKAGKTVAFQRLTFCSDCCISVRVPPGRRSRSGS